MFRIFIFREEPHPSIWNKGSNPLPGTDKASLVLPSSISKISRIFGSEPESPFSGAADFFLNTPQQPPSPCPNCAARVHDTQKSSEMTSLMAISTNQYDDVDFDNGHWKLKASESIITNRGDDYDSGKVLVFHKVRVKVIKEIVNEKQFHVYFKYF